MQGCGWLLILLLVLGFIVAIWQVLVAVITMVLLLLLLVVILLIPTWATSFLLERSEEKTLIHFVLEIVHALAYAILAVLLSLLLKALSVMPKDQFGVGEAVFLFFSVGCAAYVATIIVTGLKLAVGRTLQVIVFSLGVLVLGVAIMGFAFMRVMDWQTCERDNQWLIQGVDFVRGEIAGDKGSFLFNNRLPNKTKVWVSIRENQNGRSKSPKGPYDCQTGECRVEVTFSSAPNFQNQYLEVSFDTDEYSKSEGLLGFLLPYSVLFRMPSRERTLYQVVTAHCNLFTLERRGEFKAVGTITLK